MSDSEYSTISAHSTTDTSVHDSSYEDSSSSSYYSSHSSYSDTDDRTSDSTSSSSIDQSLSQSYNESMSISQSLDSVHQSVSLNESVSATVGSFTVEVMRNPAEASTQGSSFQNVGSDTEVEWDVTNSSLDVPRSEPKISPIRGFISNVKSLFSDRMSRRRSWSLEECSICCEIMLSDQELKSLACAHRFHAACVRPWLQEQQTCPNCRKQA